MKSTFGINDIKAGYLLVVEDDDGIQFNMTVIPGNSGGEANMRLGCCEKSHWWPLDEFDEDLEYCGYKIIRVYGTTANRFLLDNNTTDRGLLWTRPERKKMTVKEIEAALGYPIEVVM